MARFRERPYEGRMLAPTPQPHARAGSEVKKRWELEGAHQVATLDLTVAIAVYLDDEDGNGDNGNEQESDEDEHEVPFRGDGVARHGGDIARV